MFGRLMNAVRPQKTLGGEIEQVMGLMMNRGQWSPIKSENAAFGAQMYAKQSPSLTLTRTGLSMAYMVNETAHRCVDLRAQKLANIPVRVLDRKTRRPIPDHPLLKAMDFSREYYRKPLVESIEYGWCLFGETYIEKVRDQYRSVVALLWLNPQAMTPFIAEGGIKWFEYTPSGQFTYTQRYMPQAIIYDYSYNPDDDFRGLSLMSVAMGSVNLSKFIDDYLNAYFSNDARPGGILTARGSTVFSKTDQDRLLLQWKEQLGGTKNKKKTVFLPASLEWQDVQDRPADQHSSLSERADRKIARTFGVPYTMIESQEQRTDNDEDKKSFYEDTIFPRCNQIAELVNHEVMPYFGDPETEEFSFDVDKVRVTYGNQVQRSTALTSRLLAGGMSINEYRREFGQTDVEGGDLYLFPKNATPVNEGELGMVVQQQREAEERAAEEKRQQFEATMQLKEKQGAGNPASGASAPQETSDERSNAINLQGRNNQPAKAELAAWQRKTARKGLKAGRTFSAEFVSDSVASYVRGRLLDLPDDAAVDDVRMVFAEARAMLASEDDEEAFEAMRSILKELGLG